MLGKYLVKRHHLIFKYGDHFKYLYAVRTGSLKIYSITADGKEHIYGFKMSGNLIGFDAIKNTKHFTFSETLENSSICLIPSSQIEAHPLRKHIINLISNEIQIAYHLIFLLSQKDAKKRLAIFLYKMSKRFSIRGFSKYEFRLSMTRKEIGNYLCLTVETISRQFHQLKRLGIINVMGKHIQINSHKLLKLITV